jgi:Protein of unknown function (DUF3102)
MSLTFLPPTDEANAVTWVIRITESWRASVEAIIEVGRLLMAAKAALPHGEFGPMIETRLPFGARTAQRLMAIASDSRLTNPHRVSLLPASYSTLAELTHLSDDELASGFAQKIICPDMIRADIEYLRPLLRRHGSDGGVEGHALEWGRQSEPRKGQGDGMREPTLSASESGLADHQAGVEPGPSETQMPSGGLAIAHRRVEPEDSLDFFPTPPWATRALFERVFVHMGKRGHCQFQTVWEPACGEGHMAEPLREYFREMHASDIKDYGAGYPTCDFLQARDHSADWIITNPPFNDSPDFVLKALKLAGHGVAMFVRLAWLESADRYDRIFKDHPPTLIAIFSERVPLHKGRWEEDGTTMTAYIWLVWIKGAEPRAPFWIPPGCRDALTKPDDGKRFGKKSEDEAA